MTKYAVYQVEIGADLGYGPERWLGVQVGCFDTEAEADAFADSYYDYCEVATVEV